MIVDDSAVIRGLITRILDAEPDIEVVASVADGKYAVPALRRQPVDVIVLDIEMPQVDGLTAIPLLLAVAPWVKIIMASTLTLKNADVTLRALDAGAADYIPKPTATRDMMGPAAFNRELVEKIRNLGGIARNNAPRSATSAPLPRAVAVAAPNRPVSATTSLAPPPLRVAKSAPVTRPMTAVVPRVLAIGSSTGGPQALFNVLKHLSGALPMPVLLTQHMPPTFTTILAEHISRTCNVAALEAQDGMPIEKGKIYVAPGNYHMTAVDRGGVHTIVLNQDPPENYCRPSVDPMMRSLAKLYGGHVLAVILTGMGQDGLEGCRTIVNAGGNVIAQDEASSVVWGMPGAVSMAGLCSAILPVNEVGPRLRQLTFRAA
jgi:two-component system chemotaxis response regulator CheB